MPGGAEPGGADGDRLPQALGAAGDDHHAAVEPLVGEQRHAATSLTATGRRSRSERSAARPITSGARASATGDRRRHARADGGGERLPLAHVGRRVALDEEVRHRRQARAVARPG